MTQEFILIQTGCPMSSGQWSFIAMPLVLRNLESNNFFFFSLMFLLSSQVSSDPLTYPTGDVYMYRQQVVVSSCLVKSHPAGRPCVVLSDLCHCKDDSLALACKFVGFVQLVGSEGMMVTPHAPPRPPRHHAGQGRAGWMTFPHAGYVGLCVLGRLRNLCRLSLCQGLRAVAPTIVSRAISKHFFFVF